MERREYLTAAGVSLTVGLAGCLGDDSEGEPTVDLAAYDRDDPEAVAEAWYATMEAGDVDGRLSLMHSEHRAWIEEQGDTEAALDPFGGLEDSAGVEIEWEITVEDTEIVEENADPDDIVERFHGIGREETVEEREFVVHDIAHIADDDTVLVEIELTQLLDIEGESPNEMEQETLMLLVEEDDEWTVFDYVPAE